MVHETVIKAIKDAYFFHGVPREDVTIEVDDHRLISRAPGVDIWFTPIELSQSDNMEKYIQFRIATILRGQSAEQR